MGTVAPNLLWHQRNASNIIVNSTNSSMLSKDDFGVGRSAKIDYTVA